MILLGGFSIHIGYCRCHGIQYALRLMWKRKNVVPHLVRFLRISGVQMQEKGRKRRVASLYHAPLAIIPAAALHRRISRGIGIFISSSISLVGVLRHHSARRYRLLLQSSHSHMTLLTAHNYAANETPTSVR